MSSNPPARPTSWRVLSEVAVGPQLVSGSYIVVNALWGGILSFTLSNDIVHDNFAAHLLAVISAQALFSATIAMAYKWNVANNNRISPRQFIFVFVLAGALRGLLLQALLNALNLTSNGGYLYRVYSGITSLGLSAWFWAMLLGIVLEWRKQTNRLAADKTYLQSLQTTVDQQVSSATKLEIEAFRTYLMTNLRVNEKSDVGKVREELLSVISGVIRPVVEQMLSRRTAVELPPEEVNESRVKFDNVLDFVSVSRSIQPLVQVLPATPAALAAAAVIYGWPKGLLVMGAFCLLWPLCLYAAKFTLAPALDRLSNWWRIAGVLAVAGLASIPVTVSLAWIKPIGEGGWVPILFAVYSLVTGLVQAMWFAYLDELARVYRSRDQYLESIHWKVAEVNSRRWHQQLYFARRVHGALQSEVAAVAIRIEQELFSGGTETVSVDQIRLNLQERVESVFSAQPAVANPMDVLAEIAETWDGICRVSVALGHDDANRVMNDPIAVDTALEIVREGVSNAIRHGNAEDVWVSISLPSSDLVRVEVINNGLPLDAVEREGMGTKYLQECTVSHSLREERNRTHLVANIPFRS